MELKVADARDHLEMVDRILGEANTGACDSGAGYYIVWGIFGALCDIAAQLVWVGHRSMAFYIPAVIALVVAITLSIYWSAQERRSPRISRVDRFVGFVFSAATLSAAVAAIGGHNLLPQWAEGAIWSIAIAVPLFVLGFMDQRRSLVGAAVLIGSVVVANFVPPALTGYALAAGMLAGLTLTGLMMHFAPARRG